MRLTKNQLDNIIKQELLNLINEREIDEKVLPKLANIGKAIKNLIPSFGVKSGTKIAGDVSKRLADEEARKRARELAAASAAKNKQSANTAASPTAPNAQSGGNVAATSSTVPSASGTTTTAGSTNPPESFTSSTGDTKKPTSQSSIDSDSVFGNKAGEKDASSKLTSDEERALDTGESEVAKNRLSQLELSLKSQPQIQAIFNKNDKTKLLLTKVQTFLQQKGNVIFTEQIEPNRFDLSGELDKLDLNDDEKTQLKSFLKTLFSNNNLRVSFKIPDENNVMPAPTIAQSSTTASPAGTATTTATTSPTATSATTNQSVATSDTKSSNKNSTTQQKPLATLEQIPDFVKSFAPQLAKLNLDLSNKQQDIQKVLNSLVKNKMLVSEQVLNKKSKLKEQENTSINSPIIQTTGYRSVRQTQDNNKDESVITYQDKLKLAPDLNIPQMDAQFTAKVENTIGIKNLVTKIKADTNIEDEKLILDILKIVFRNKKLAFNQNSQFSNTSIQQTPSPKKDASKVRGKAAYDSEAYSNRDVVPSFDDQVYGVAAENKKLKLKESKEFERMKKLAGIIKG